MKIVALLPMLMLVASSCSAASDEREAKLNAISEHRSAVYIKDGWIRDPYIVLGPDQMFYLTGTMPVDGDPREVSDKYNIGLGEESIVGGDLRVWKSPNLVDWEYLGVIYSVTDSPNYNKKNPTYLWAPELHWVDSSLVLVHCPKYSSTLAVNRDGTVDNNWEYPYPENFRKIHDPSLFVEDGKLYIVYGYKGTYLAKIKPDFSGFESEPYRIDPSDRIIGHEGVTIKKIGSKYVYFGTGWSTDEGRKGSYNMYYCTADNIYGPYSERRFMGRFLGHGTPFQDKSGNWWCTAFFNANVPPLPVEGIENRDLSETAQTINESGTTIVPLEVRIMEDGDVYIRAIDEHYRNPGPDEVQQFEYAEPYGRI